MPGAIVIGIASATAAGLLLGVSHLPAGAWLRMPRFDTVFQADLRSAFDIRLLPLLLSIVMVDFFDTIGTVTAIAETGDLHDREGRIPRLRSILAIDSISAVIGGTFGVSSVTSYVESAAGVAEGARTGLHNVVVAALFAVCMFAAPLVAIVPAAATAPALIVVGFLMCQQITRIDFSRPGHRDSRVSDPPDDAAHVLDLSWDRLWIHRLSWQSICWRARARRAADDVCGRRALRRLFLDRVSGQRRTLADSRSGPVRHSYCCLYRSPARYLSPVSTATVATTLPGPSSRAN